MVPKEQLIPLILSYVFCGLFLILFYFIITAYFFRLCKALFWQRSSDSIFQVDDPEMKQAAEVHDQHKDIKNEVEAPEAPCIEKAVNPV